MIFLRGNKNFQGIMMHVYTFGSEQDAVAG